MLPYIYRMEQNNQIRVAFAEDHVAIRKAIITFSQTVSDNIIFTIEADDGVQLLQQLEQAEELPDICILDINMPNMDGHTVLVEIKKRWPSIKFLILTAFKEEYPILRMIKSGAGGYLLKNCTAIEIVEALEDIYQTGYHYSSAAGRNLFSMVKNNIIKVKEEFDGAEVDILKYSAANLTYDEMAAKMNITTKSLESKRRQLCSKLKIESRAELALFAFQSGLIPDETDKHRN